MSQLISEGSLVPRSKSNLKEDGPVIENPTLGPLAMSFDDKKGWIAKPLGPASRHWKRLAREINKGAT